MLLKAVKLTLSSLFERNLSKGDCVLERYEVREMLGKGSYGYSYLVFDKKLNRLSVLKILRFHQRLTKRGRSFFYHEMEILKSLTHPSFPDFYESGVFDNIPFYTMEYIEGKTFEQLIFHEGKIYTEIEAFMLGLELLPLISSLHDKGIVHRDIRIPNIMLDQGKLKLIDFGLARWLDHRKGNSKANPVPKAIAPISDFYGLGHFLLFLLYSDYTPKKNQKEKSWEEELHITIKGKKVIKRLLLIDSPYDSTEEIYHDIEDIILEYRRNKHVIF